MFLHRRIIDVGVLTLAFCFQSQPCRADEVQAVVHALTGPPIIATSGEKWEARKKMLDAYDPDQLVRALINELDVDRGSRLWNHVRDEQAQKIFHALELPPKLVCEELDKPQAPERKAALIFLLRHCRDPQVTQALLRQMNDERSNGEPPQHREGIYFGPLRVKDDAYNALVEILDGPDRVSVLSHHTKDQKDEIIRENLARLKLTPP